MDKMLEVRDLRIYYRSIYGDYKSVDGVSLEVFRDEVFSIAGESGCGKSSLVDGVLRLVKTPGYIPSGEVIFEGTDLLKLSEKELNKIRWTKLAYIPQGAMNSLNPFLKIKEQMMDAILDHSHMKKEEARQLVMQLLQEVGLSTQVAEIYPHELSGGMKQRVIIAMAIALKPTLIIADEPTTALDVVVQKGILQLLRNLKDKYHMSVVIVSHSMAVHAEVGDRVAIMYAGKIVEISSVYELFEEPLHPYSKGLIIAVPSLERKIVKGIPGLAPSPLNWPKGCRFHPRCSFVMNICKEIEPPIKSTQQGRLVACHLYGD